jgi:hypothetical protein
VIRSAHAPAIVATLGIVAPALADHNHLTVDTGPSSLGDQVQIVAGYLPTESMYTIAEGRLLRNGEIAVYHLTDQLPQAGDFNGWYAGFDLLLTSDYYYFTGRLDGGNFMWELSDVIGVNGAPSAPAAAWGTFQGVGFFAAEAVSTASNRVARSYDTQAGGHEHNQGYAFNVPGLYDLVFIAWDSNGVYLDSEPLKIRFLVGCAADFNHDGFVDGIDYDQFNNAFESGDLSADYNGDGFVDGIDYDMFNNDFESGC